MLPKRVIPGSAIEADAEEQSSCAHTELLSAKGRQGQSSGTGSNIARNIKGLRYRQRPKIHHWIQEAIKAQCKCPELGLKQGLPECLPSDTVQVIRAYLLTGDNGS